ncbi:MAG TPA: alpha/beta hydrolase [Gemmata sp.]
MDPADTLLNHPAVTRRVFHPALSAPPGPSLVVDVGGCRLGCYTAPGAPGAGWVVHFHGNGELASETMKYRAGLFTRAGVNVCFAEYRGYGWSDGEPALAAMLGDGEHIVSALGAPPERVVTFGRSLGSLYAIELARRLPALAGVVLESGIADPCDVWSFAPEAAEIGCSVAEVRAAMVRHFDHRAKLSGFTGPVLVLHAARDRLVPVSHAERLHAWAGGTTKRLVTFPNGDHNSIFPANEDEYTAELYRFLRDTQIAVP